MNLVTQSQLTAAQVELLETQKEIDHAFEVMKLAVVRSFHRVWNNNNGVSRADMLAGLGTNAVACFTAHAAAVAFLMSQGVTLDPVDITPPVAFTFHNDGTVTLDQ